MMDFLLFTASWTARRRASPPGAHLGPPNMILCCVEAIQLQFTGRSLAFALAGRGLEANSTRNARRRVAEEKRLVLAPEKLFLLVEASGRAFSSRAAPLGPVVTIDSSRSIDS
jgi:hypothetical protein